MLRYVDTMICYTPLGEIVCSNPFRSVPATNLFKVTNSLSFTKKVQGKNTIDVHLISGIPAVIEVLIVWFEF